MKDDERQLFIDFFNQSKDGWSWEDVINAACRYMNRNRAKRMFQKWGRKGYVEIGINHCFISEKGEEVAKTLFSHR